MPSKKQLLSKLELKLEDIESFGPHGSGLGVVMKVFGRLTEYASIKYLQTNQLVSCINSTDQKTISIDGFDIEGTYKFLFWRKSFTTFVKAKQIYVSKKDKLEEGIDTLKRKSTALKEYFMNFMPYATE